MTARLTFDNVEFVQNSEQTVRVREGQTFSLEFQGAPEEGGLVVATTRDRVLRVDEPVGPFVITALATGDSEVQLQNASRSVIFWLAIEVYNDEGTSLKSTTSVEPRS